MFKIITQIKTNCIDKVGTKYANDIGLNTSIQRKIKCYFVTFILYTYICIYIFLIVKNLNNNILTINCLV